MRILFLLLLSCNLFATKYYVDATGGSDAANGTSTGTAWKTLDHVHTRYSSIVAGDSVLLKRGEVWKESFILPASGSSGNPIVFATYGAGSYPIITKRDTLWGWSATSKWTQSGNSWYIHYPSAESGASYYRLWLNGVETLSSATITLTSTNKWNYDYSTQRFYVYSSTNPATTFTSIETFNADTVNAYSVWANSKNYIKFYNIDFRGGFECVNTGGGSNWLIDNCNIGLDCGGNGLLGSFSNTVEVSNCTFDTGEKLMNGFNAQGTSDGIHLGNGCSNWLIHNNTLLDWVHTAIGINVTSLTSTSRNNIIYNNYITAPDIDYGRAFGIDSQDTTLTGNELYGNTVYNMPTRSQFNCRGTYFHNNVIDGVRGISYLPGEAQGIMLEGYGSNVPQDMLFYNNTIINCADFGIYVGGVNGVKKNNLFINNLIYNCDTVSGYQIKIDDHATVQNNTFRNNLLYKSGVTDLVFYGHSATNDYPHTVAEFNAENGTASDVITGNITGNPLLLSNYHVSPASPAINAGYNVSLPYQGAAPDIGAFEGGIKVATKSNKILTTPSGKIITIVQ